MSSPAFFLLEFTKIREHRQDPVDTPETEKGKEPSDNVTNALKQKDMVKHKHETINDNDEDHIGIVDAPLPRA